MTSAKVSRVLWIAVDITSIGLYSVKGVKLIAIEFCIFLALAVLGIYSWYRLWSRREVEVADAGS